MGGLAVSAWVLIVSTLSFGPHGAVALQEFSTRERCEAAAKFIKDDAADSNAARVLPLLKDAERAAAIVRARCVPK
jgi:hypothetical protein